MSADKSNKEKFDEMLEQALQKHAEPVPADFAERVLRQVKEAEERRILARVVLQEKLALAGCILLGIGAIAAAMVFFTLDGRLIEQIRGLINRAPQTLQAVGYQWQLYAVFLGVLGLAVYSLVDLLIGDS